MATRQYGNGRSELVGVRLSQEEMQAVQKASETLGMSKVDYIRKVLDNSLTMSGFKAA